MRMVLAVLLLLVGAAQAGDAEVIELGKDGWIVQGNPSGGSDTVAVRNIGKLRIMAYTRGGQWRGMVLIDARRDRVMPTHDWALKAVTAEDARREVFAVARLKLAAWKADPKLAHVRQAVEDARAACDRIAAD